MDIAPVHPISERALVAPPLAGLPANFTEPELVDFLMTGKRPDGTTARPPMLNYRFTREDAEAVVAYLRFW